VTVESSRRLDVDADIRFATKPPAALYHDDDWFRLGVERVLARGWHVVADAASVAAKESAMPTTLLPGALDEPLVLTRDRKERLHCLANSCTDGGELVVADAGPAMLLKCAAHGRTFRLDGELMEAPGFEGVAGFPSPSDSLARLPVATIGPLVFASIAPATPFEDLVRPLREALPSAALQPGVESDEELGANWALCVEDALSGLGEDVELAPAAVVRRGDVLAAWLFPATFVEFAPHRVTALALQPSTAGRTRVTRWSFLAAGEWEDTDVAWFDADRLRRRSLGLRSRAYRPGRYAPRRDRAVHHFHLLLADALAKA
jgi:choline monooxygenase